jgi:hypothetical protein
MTEPTEPAAAEEPVALEKATPTPDPDEPEAAPEPPAAEHEAEAHPIWSQGEGEETAAPKSRRGWIIGAVALAVLFGMALSCAFGVLFVVDHFRDSPTEVVEGYLQATHDQDADKIDDITCDALRTGREGLDEFGAGANPDNRQFFKDLKWKIGEDRKIAGDKHEVDADVTIRAGETPGSVKLTFLVVNQDGWKVCGLTD